MAPWGRPCSPPACRPARRPEAWLLSEAGAAAIGSVHRGHVEAGARLVLTSSFGANPLRLAGSPLEGRSDEVCRAAVAVARACRRDRRDRRREPRAHRRCAGALRTARPRGRAGRVRPGGRCPGRGRCGRALGGDDDGSPGGPGRRGRCPRGRPRGSGGRHARVRQGPDDVRRPAGRCRRHARGTRCRRGRRQLRRRLRVGRGRHRGDGRCRPRPARDRQGERGRAAARTRRADGLPCDPGRGGCLCAARRGRGRDDHRGLLRDHGGPCPRHRERAVRARARLSSRGPCSRCCARPGPASARSPRPARRPAGAGGSSPGRCWSCPAPR